MSMTLAARSHHVQRVSNRAPRGAGSGFAPLVWFRRKLRARPGTTLAHCAFGLGGIIVLMNALAFQREASPRAFLVEQQARQAATQAAAPSAVPMPPQRPAELGPAILRPPAAVGSAPAPVQTSAQTSAPAPAASSQRQGARPEAVQRDPIGDLIRSGSVAGSSPTAETARGAVPESRPVLSAQRALNRLGFGPVKADGVFGEETRAALERFERDRRIAVTRDLSPRTLRELTAASGMRME
ncbi:MAG: peptidoglycan-binding protein [Beijerinckiaceae bacterium]|nr:peptidoglycan-binding protein [Beijerinckiaceae bacterium]